jgi:hypothetical protein
MARIIAVLFILALLPQSLWAAFGEDLEKPKPEFTRDQDKITAKLIPRAKSTSITIDFEILGGKIREITPVDFATANRPGVDSKDFRSELFMLEITDVKPGAEISVSASSSFFSSSTQLWVFNEKLTDAWMSGDAQNMPLTGRVRQLVIQVKDGGAFDTDGKADGKIIVVLGSKDSFWGYAIGTLFIRFFGIFIVLGVLMIGMFISGKFFQSLDAKAGKAEKKIEAAPSAVAVPAKKPDPAEDDITPEMAAAIAAAIVESEITPEMAAAIAVALHAETHISQPLDLMLSSSGGWANHGRQQMMAERSKIFNR